VSVEWYTGPQIRQWLNLEGFRNGAFFGEIASAWRVCAATPVETQQDVIVAVEERLAKVRRHWGQLPH
jgi:hypothetical protein